MNICSSLRVQQLRRFLRQDGELEMRLAGKMMILWMSLFLVNYTQCHNWKNINIFKYSRTLSSSAALVQHQRNILKVWENINCYKISLTMDFLCTRAWLEMTDISSILVSTLFQNISFHISLQIIAGSSQEIFLTLLWERWEVRGEVKR